MRIQDLRVENFRCFDSREFKGFSPSFSVLIGDNMTGKTAVLEALSIALGNYVRGVFDQYLPGPSLRGRSPVYGILAQQVRTVTRFAGGATQIEPQFPSVIHCRADLGSPNTATWQNRRESMSGEPILDLGGHPGLTGYIEQTRRAAQSGEDWRLPVVAFYATSRLWPRFDEHLDPRAPGTRLEGYAYCLDTSVDSLAFQRWFKTYEIAALQRRVTIPVLECVRGAVISALPSWTHVAFDVERDELLARNREGQTLPFHNLSDGVRSMLSLVADIARRAAMLNPWLGQRAAIETPGVVLIDEIDLHLHPRWQRTVLADLRRTFPKIQFIATTHSPFIVQALQPGDVLVNLEAREHSGNSIEDIAEHDMGVPLPQRSQRYLEMMAVAEKYLQLVKQGSDAPDDEKERIKRKLDELLLPYSDDPAFQAFLKLERTAGGLGRGE